MSSTTFSYAQAAKGHTISQPSPQLTSSSAPPSIKDDVPTANTSVTAPSVASNDAEIRDVDKKAKAETECAQPPTQGSEAASIGGGGSGSSTASVTGQSVKTGRESDATMVDLQHQTEDKDSRSASQTSRANDGPDNKKGRKGRKGRSNDKDAQSEQNADDEKEKEHPKPVLSEAPPPAVNFWAKRIEAQQQAVKAKLSSAPTASSGPSPSSSVQIQDVKKQQSTEERDTPGALANGTNGDKPQRAPTELAQGTDQAPRRSGPRGSRTNDKDEKSPASLPPVADASFWPDPKSAATTEDVIRKPQERVDSGEKESQEEAGTGKKKTWVNLDIVPTVVFNTPLPPRGAKARGGARGGREAGSGRGSHGNASGASTSGPTGDRAASASGSTAPRATASRPREGSVPSRTSQPQPALPHATKRTSFDAASRDQRKPTASTNGELPRESGVDASASSSKRGSSVRDIRTELGAAGFEPGQTVTRPLPQERANHIHQKGSDNVHPASHGQQYPAREGRSDRGRGNGYRGRGGHNGGSGSHLPSASYTPNGQYPIHAPYTSRQNSAAPSPPPFPGQFPMSFGQQHRGRGKWAGSGQTSGRNGTNGASFPPKQAPVNDYPVAQYAAAFMYPPQYDPIVHVIRTQVEYYLSLENLCKDYYLRTQMDSQGFVKLSVIAGFKRMRELVKDQEVIRLACSTSDLLDYGIGDDGHERLRLRDRWGSFVLPYNERSEAARNDGPKNFTLYVRNGAQMPPFGGPVVPFGYHAPSSAGMYSTFPEDQMFQAPYANGAHYEHAPNGGDLNGHRYGLETQLSAVVPEYSPPMSPLTLESMTNFTDAQVEKMIVVLDFDKKDGSTSSDSAGDAVYLADDATHGGVNGMSGNAEAPSVNGEAPNETVDAESASQVKKSGRPYNEIRREALDKRQNSQPGETPALMRKLYQLWSQMLLKDFNSNVYLEFRDLALSDAGQATPARCGLKYLLDFYDKLLLENNGEKPWPEGRAIPGIFQLHFQEALGIDRSIGAKNDTAI